MGVGPERGTGTDRVYGDFCTDGQLHPSPHFLQVFEMRHETRSGDELNDRGGVHTLIHVCISFFLDMFLLYFLFRVWDGHDFTMFYHTTMTFNIFFFC